MSDLNDKDDLDALLEVVDALCDTLCSGFHIGRRLVCGFIADRIGSLKTLFLVSSLQAVTMLPSDDLATAIVPAGPPCTSRTA
jgi:hypothetical protein